MLKPKEISALKDQVVDQILFLQKVKKVRRKHLSAETGLSETFLTDIKLRRKDPSLESLVKILDASECKIIIVNKNQ